MSPSPTGGQRPPLQIAANGDLIVETPVGEVRFRRPVVYQEQEPEVRSQSSVVSGQLESATDNGLRTTDARQGARVTRHFIDGRFIPLANNEVTFRVASYDHSRPLVIDPALVYSTLISGSSTNNGPSASGIAVDSSGNGYIVGRTRDSTFPTTTGAFQTTFGGGTYDAFVSKFDASTVGPPSLVYSTYLGGSGDEIVNGRTAGIAVDSSGNAYVTGGTNSSNFPLLSPIQSALNLGSSNTCNSRACDDAYVSVINSAGTALTFSTYLGGPGDDDGSGIFADGSGNIYVTGEGQSGFPTTPGAFQTTTTNQAPFVTKISLTLSSVGVSPTSLTFASQTVGTTSAAQTVTLTNTGTGTLGSIVVSTNLSAFAVSNTTCGATLAASATCAVSVTFTPSAMGAAGATLTFTDNASNSPQVISLSGTGVAPVVSLSPSSLTFGATVIGATSPSQSVTVSNTGTAALSITGIAASANFALASATTCSTSTPLAGGSSCVIAVAFAPTASGNLSGTLTISDNDPSSPQVVAFSGTGQDFTLTAPTTSLTVPAGLSATYSLWLTPHDAFAGTVALTCTGAPAGATCAANPASVTLNGSVVSMAALDVTTTAPSLAVPRGPVIPPLPGHWPLALGLLALLMIAALPLTRSAKPEHPLPEGARVGISGLRWATRARFAPKTVRARALALVPLAAILLCVVAWTGCGGGGPAPHVKTGGTPAGTYSLTVTATSGNLTHTTTVTLVVQ